MRAGWLEKLWDSVADRGRDLLHLPTAGDVHERLRELCTQLLHGSGDRLGHRLGHEQVGEGVAEQCRGADDHQDHHALAHRVGDDLPHVPRLPHAVDHRDQQQAEHRADAGRLRRRGHAAVEHVEDADDDRQERQHLGQDREALAPADQAPHLGQRVAVAVGGVERPCHEQRGEQQAR